MRLQVLVKGAVAWSVDRIDSTHVRVTLVDPGYTDPAESNAVIVLQRHTGIACKDILNGENLNITDKEIRLKVPIGLFQIIDITHSELDDISWLGFDKVGNKPEFSIFPNPGNGKLNIKLPINFNSKIINYSIYNTIRTCLLTETVYNNSEEFKVNIMNLPKGLYHIVVRLQNGFLSGKYLLFK